MPRSKIKSPTEAEIQAQIAADPEDFEPTDEEARTAKPFAEAFPELAAAIKRSRGRPRVAKPKELVSLRLDPDVIDKFKSTGKGWQDRVNQALKRAKI